MSASLTQEVKLDINYGLTAEEIRNIIANELSKYLKLQVNVQVMPKEVHTRTESFGYKKNADHAGNKPMAKVEAGEPSGRYSFLDDPSKFSFAGV